MDQKKNFKHQFQIQKNEKLVLQVFWLRKIYANINYPRIY